MDCNCLVGHNTTYQLDIPIAMGDGYNFLTADV